jgi:hypothetical protein
MPDAARETTDVLADLLSDYSINGVNRIISICSLGNDMG